MVVIVTVTVEITHARQGILLQKPTSEIPFLLFDPVRLITMNNYRNHHCYKEGSTQNGPCLSVHLYFWKILLTGPLNALVVTRDSVPDQDMSLVVPSRLRSSTEASSARSLKAMHVLIFFFGIGK
jgi:hypothetical protein